MKVHGALEDLGPFKRFETPIAPLGGWRHLPAGVMGCAGDESLAQFAIAKSRMITNE